MSIFLEHIIRSSLLYEQLDPWRYKIFGSDTLRGQYVNKIAQESGAKQGILIKATRSYKNSTQNMSDIIDGLVDFIETKDTDFEIPLRDFYNDGNHRFVFITKKSTDNKKLIILLIFEKSSYQPLIDAIVRAETDTQYFNIVPSDVIKDMTNVDIQYMTGADYTRWKNAIDASLNTLKSQVNSLPTEKKSSGVRIYNDIEKIKDNTKLIDIKQIVNKLSISKIQDEPGSDSPVKEKIKIEKNIGGFIGTAWKMQSVTGDIKYIPIEGKQSVVHKADDEEGNEIEFGSGTFTGTFSEFGHPQNGTIVWSAPVTKYTAHGIKNFTGELYPSSKKLQDLNDPSFRFKYKSGTSEYWNGWIFSGDWNNIEYGNNTSWKQGTLQQKIDDSSRKQVLKNNTQDYFNMLPDHVKYKYIYQQLIGKMIQYEGTWHPRGYPNTGKVLDSKGNLIGNWNNKNKFAELEKGFIKKRNDMYVEINDIISEPFKSSVETIDVISQITYSDDTEKIENDDFETAKISDINFESAELIELSGKEYYSVTFNYDYDSIGILPIKMPNTNISTQLILINKETLKEEFIDIQIQKLNLNK